MLLIKVFDMNFWLKKNKIKTLEYKYNINYKINIAT